MRPGDLVLRRSRFNHKQCELEELRERRLILTVLVVYPDGKVEAQWFSPDGVVNEDIFPPDALEEL